MCNHHGKNDNRHRRQEYYQNNFTSIFSLKHVLHHLGYDATLVVSEEYDSIKNF